MVDIIKQVVHLFLNIVKKIRQECVIKKFLPIENYHLVLMKQRKIVSIFYQFSWSTNGATLDDNNFRRIIRAVKRKDFVLESEYFCHGRNSLALI